jgi:hypothetical protein
VFAGIAQTYAITTPMNGMLAVADRGDPAKGLTCCSHLAVGRGTVWWQADTSSEQNQTASSQDAAAP